MARISVKSKCCFRNPTDIGIASHCIKMTIRCIESVSNYIYMWWCDPWVLAGEDVLEILQKINNRIIGWLHHSAEHSLVSHVNMQKRTPHMSKWICSNCPISDFFHLGGSPPLKLSLLYIGEVLLGFECIDP